MAKFIVVDHNAFRRHIGDEAQPVVRPRFGCPTISDSEIHAVTVALILAQRGLETDDEAKAISREIVASQRSAESFLDPKIALTPYSQAQRQIHLAVRSNGRQRQKLARRALAACADCADAYWMLAESETPENAIPLLNEGIAAGERLLKSRFGAEKIDALLCAAEVPERLNDRHPLEEREISEAEVGSIAWWGTFETRPYLRCRSLLASHLFDLGEEPAAAAHLRALLRLCPRDNPGNRVPLAGWLSEQCVHDTAALAELESLLIRYAYDTSAPLLYSRALHLFRIGSKALADKALEVSFAQNGSVPAILCGYAPMALNKTFIRPGSEEEASEYLVCAHKAWREEDTSTWLASTFAARLKDFLAEVQAEKSSESIEPL